MGPQREKQHNHGKGEQKASASFPPSQMVNVSYFLLVFYSFLLNEPEKSAPLCAALHAKHQGAREH